MLTRRSNERDLIVSFHVVRRDGRSGRTLNTDCSLGNKNRRAAETDCGMSAAGLLVQRKSGGQYHESLWQIRPSIAPFRIPDASGLLRLGPSGLAGDFQLA